MAVRLWCANEVVAVDPSIAEMSRPRVHIAAFEDHSARPTTFSVERIKGLQGQRLDTPLGLATVALEERRLLVDVEEGPFLGELALRLAYSVLTSRAGGLLIHASGLARGDSALVACGKSGDGKSTLARLSAFRATVLTDEVMQLFPDGRVAGTPFRSDFDNVGAPGFHAAKYFVGLRKAEHEALDLLEPAAAFNLAIEQAFEPHAFALPRVETRRRLMQFLSTVSLRTLAFRKDPAVGAFIASALERA